MSNRAAFDVALDFTLKWEGGLSLDPNDSGNWTGGAINSGELRGTKYGISAAAYPDLDIQGLTVSKAAEIYHRDYWRKLDLPDDVSLEVGLVLFDAAVNHGVGRAKEWWLAVGRDVNRFMVRRMDFYTSLGAFGVYGRGWMNRVTDLWRTLNELRESPGVVPVPAERFFLIVWNRQFQLPLAKAAVVGDKLYVRLGRNAGRSEA